MIPLAALKALPWKAIAQVVALLVLAALIWLTLDRAWAELPKARKALETAEAALKLEVECGETSKCAERVAKAKLEGEQINQESVNRYEQELADLRNRPIPTRVIRVCPPADNLRDAASPGGAGQRPAAEGVVLGADEFDTRPLRELAIEADELSARCRSLLERDRALAKRRN